MSITVRGVDPLDDLRELFRLAERTDRCLTVHQIRACGYSAKHIRVLARRGVLQRVFRGVYVVATTALTDAQVMRCALLYAGPSAHLAGRTALEARGVAPPHRSGEFWVGVVGGQRRPKRPTRIALDRTNRVAIVRFARVAAPVETESVNGLSVAAIAHALVDVAAREPASMLRRIVREADYRELLNEDDLNRAFNRCRRGTVALRKALPAGPLTEALSGGPDSRAAHRLLRALVARGLVPTSVNQPLRIDEHECRPDLLYLDQSRRLAVEADGPQHRKPERLAADARRDAILSRARIETLRIETERIWTDLSGAVQDVIDALHRQSLAFPDGPA